MIFNQREAPLHDYFKRELGLHLSEDFRAICYVPDRKRGWTMQREDIAVAVAYNAFIGKMCCMHVVVKDPKSLRRDFIREAFRYPFEMCGVEYVIGFVDSTNERAIRFNKSLGFKIRDTIEGGGLDGDAIIMSMRKSECRWIRPLDRKVEI